MNRSIHQWLAIGALGVGILSVVGSTALANENESEREVPLKEVPAAARSAIESHAEGGTIKKVEENMKDGKVTSYEADVTINGKDSKIEVDPTGKLLEFEKD